MRALAAEGVFAEREDGAFEMTDLAQFLRSNAMGPIARHWGADWHYAAWGGLEYSIKTGEPAFPVVHGVDHFTYCASIRPRPRIDESDRDVDDPGPRRRPGL